MKPGDEIRDTMPPMADDVEIEIIKGRKLQHTCPKQGYNVVNVLAGEACHFCKEVM